MPLLAAAKRGRQCGAEPAAPSDSSSLRFAARQQIAGTEGHGLHAPPVGGCKLMPSAQLRIRFPEQKAGLGDDCFAAQEGRLNLRPLGLGPTVVLVPSLTG